MSFPEGRKEAVKSRKGSFAHCTFMMGGYGVMAGGLTWGVK